MNTNRNEAMTNITNADLRAILNHLHPSVTLTPKEHKLLSVMMSNPHTTYSRNELLFFVWNVNPDIATRMHTRTVDMTVSRVKKKIGDFIKPIRGFGYMFDPNC